MGIGFCFSCLIGCLCLLPICGCFVSVYQVYSCTGLMPLLLCFRGGAVRFSFFWGLFGLRVYSLWGFALLEINSYLSKKKKKERKTSR